MSKEFRDFSFPVKVSKDLKDLIPRFLENREKDLIQLQEALKTQNEETLQHLGHKLKGACGGYDFDDLGFIAKDIEEAAKEHNFILASELVAKYKKYLEEVKIEYI